MSKVLFFFDHLPPPKKQIIIFENVIYDLSHSLMNFSHDQLKRISLYTWTLRYTIIPNRNNKMFMTFFFNSKSQMM